MIHTIQSQLSSHMGKLRFLTVGSKKMPVLAVTLVFLVLLLNFHYNSPFSGGVYPAKLEYGKPNIDRYEYYSYITKQEQYISDLAVYTKMLNQPYTNYTWTGYSGDMDITELPVSGYTGLACRYIQYQNTVGIAEKKVLNDDIASAREWLLGTKYKELLTEGETDDTDTHKVLEDKWKRYSGASVWLSAYKVHLLVSRVMYARDGVFGAPTASFIRAQVFDKDWNELIGFKMPVADKRGDVHKTIEFPTIFDIPFDPETDRSVAGPEDPKIALRVNHKGAEEPVIFFNMYNGKLSGRRAYYAYRPFALDDKEEIVGFSISDFEQRETEKDWIPFFARDVGDSGDVKGFVYFIHRIDPLRILKCSMDYGVCNIVFEYDTEKYKSAVGDSVTMGSNLILLPQGVPMVEFGNHFAKKRDVWVGFSTIRLPDCGCGDTLYRPSLFVLIKENDVFRIEFQTTALDFGQIVVPMHSENIASCQSGDKSVLTAGSISSWDVVDYNTQTKEYDDYMSVVFTEGDRQIGLVQIRGILNYILGARRINTERKRTIDRLYGSEHIERSIRVGYCAVDEAKRYCKEYAEKHSFREG